MINKMLAGMILLAAASCGCSSPPAAKNPQAAARVNGKDILRSDVDRFYNIRLQGTPQKPTGDAETMARLEILHDLIDREIMSQKAAELKFQVKDSDVDAQIQQLHGGASAEEFKKDLERRGMSEQDMRTEVRRNLTVQQLMQQQVLSKIQVTDADVSRFYDENKGSFNVQETQYRLGQIVVTPNPSVPVTNLRNDKALNNDQAVGKVQHLEAQAKAGGDFLQMAREYSEDPQAGSDGGDLGYQPVSALDRLGPALKQAILKMNVGDVTQVIQTPQAFLILKLLGKREPGQRGRQDPEVISSIRAELQNRKQQVLTEAYTEQLRNEARVENYMAQEIVAGLQKAK